MDASPAQAQQLSGSEFELTPYLWGAGLSGDIGVRGAPPASVDLSFSDLLEDLSLGGMLAAEGGIGLWRFLLDGTYMKLSEDGDTPGRLFSGVGADLEVGLVQGALG